MKSFGKRAVGERLERMQASLRWAGEGFRNLHPILPGLRDHGVPRPTISDFVCGGNRRVPEGPLPSIDPRPGWAKPVDSGLRATWLGHSTVLIEIDGYRVLTDPVWGARASPSRLLGPKRFQPVPVALNLIRCYYPDLGAMLDDWGVGRWILHFEREREFINIYRRHDAVRQLSDEGFDKVLEFTKSAFEMALHFVANEESVPDQVIDPDEPLPNAKPESKPRAAAGNSSQSQSAASKAAPKRRSDDELDQR